MPEPGLCFRRGKIKKKKLGRVWVFFYSPVFGGAEAACVQERGMHVCAGAPARVLRRAGAHVCAVMGRRGGVYGGG